MKDHNPNSGENQTHFSSGGSGSMRDSAGVVSGLSHASTCSVKNAEKVSKCQRPQARSEKTGSFRIGT